ncbi:MAG TPA: hypothetical protein VEV84_11885 [Pyrinomonadaceae bacterium]|nr:hypothetical protein [Pyrinomonadaceae bacterium]
MNSHELWQVEADGRIYEAQIEEVIEWIHEGSVLPHDKVRRGSLRWVPARSVPQLNRHFRASTAVASADLFAGSGAAAFSNEGATTVTVADNPGSFVNQTSDAQAVVQRENAATRRFCKNHRDSRATYSCSACGDSLCQTCTNRFGNVRLCPTCGAMCLPFNDGDQADRTHGALNKPYARKAAETAENRPFFDTRLPFREFLAAAKLPFRQWRLSLLLGFLFAILTLGCATALIGNLSSVASTTVSFSCLFALLFIVLTKVSENVQTNQANGRFLPELKTEGLKKALLKPFRLGMLVLITAYGPFAVLITASGAYAWIQFADSVDLVEKEMRSTEERTARVLSFEEAKKENARFEQRLSHEREELLNSVLGRDSSSDNTVISKAVRSLMRLSVLFLLPTGIAFIFGLITFPAGCANALEAESAKQIFNPIATLKIFRRMGFDYFKIFFVSILAFVIAVAGGGLILLSSSSPEWIAVGFVAALTFAGCFAAYFWTVFSRLLVTTLHT